MSSNEYPVPSKTRLFPDWTKKKFGTKYKDQNTADDNFCEKLRKIRKGEVSESNIPDLHKYQEFVSKFMRYDSPYRSMLLYHGTGTGKTRTTISLYNELYNANPDWNVIVLTKKSLENNWRSELDKFLEKKQHKLRKKNVYFVAYNGPRPYLALKRRVQEMKGKGKKNTIFIIEEAHNFVSQVYGNTKTESKESLNIYYYIQSKFSTEETTRVVALTATPIINNPIEITYLFNLLRPNILKTNEYDFNIAFLTQDSIPVLKPTMVRILQQRIQGLVSFYDGEPKEYLARKTEKFVYLKMTKYMQNTYMQIEEIEKNHSKKEKQRAERGTVIITGLNLFGSGSGGMFSGPTRQGCNFVFPNIPKSISKMSKDMNGRLRPRRFQIKKRLRDKERKISDDDDPKEVNKIVTKVYEKEMREYIQALKLYFQKLKQDDIKSKHTIEDDVSMFLKHPHSALHFLETAKLSSLLRTMYECSPKMSIIVLHRVKHFKEVSVIFSNFVKMEGLEILEIYLENIGIHKYKSKSQYGNYVNLSENPETTKLLGIVNHESNVYGKNINTVLISPALAEGINIHNVQSMHILETYWNSNRVTQIIGRGRRICSHADLPYPEKWHVQVFRYLMQQQQGGETSDEKLLKLARRKKRSIDSFLKPIQESAVDCTLWLKDNQTKYPYLNCFRYASSDLINYPNNVGYIRNLDEDIIKNVSENDILLYQNREITLHEVNAVILNSNDIKKYWMDMKDGFVYDYKTNYLVGKVERSLVDQTFKMLDFDTYIISKWIMYNQFV